MKSRMALNLLFLPGTGLFPIVTIDETAWHGGLGATPNTQEGTVRL